MAIVGWLSISEWPRGVRHQPLVIFLSSNIEIVGSNLTRNMDVYVYFAFFVKVEAVRRTDPLSKKFQRLSARLKISELFLIGNRLKSINLGLVYRNGSIIN
jgi:CO dehydrogenase nickel-insertion accessory protein CooC1